MSPAVRKKLLPPIHPGEILREEFMKPLGLSANALAQGLGVTTACQRDCERTAWHYGRHGAAVGVVLFHHAGILDEPAAAI